MINIDMANIYKGFSTRGKIRPPYTVTNGEAVKVDLLNELYTRRGERVMRPNFGTTIYDLIMNPLDTYVEQEVRDEVVRICTKDPRINIQEIFTQVIDHTIRVQVQLTLKPFLDEETLLVEYTQDSREI
jgi:phage baseplate assembly protein W|tara:strand:+ start:14873 stop:15259 length:387 start_codon:yes stop_codon:yes gene_type:complete